jgi:hypothetical protein
VIHDGRFSGDSWADWLRWYAGLANHPASTPFEIAAAILGDDAIREWDEEPCASLQRIGDRWVIFVRPETDDDFRTMAIAHELGEYALRGNHGDAKEAACDAIAMALLGLSTRELYVIEDGVVYHDDELPEWQMPASVPTFPAESSSQVRFRSLPPPAKDDEEAV